MNGRNWKYARLAAVAVSLLAINAPATLAQSRSGLFARTAVSISAIQTLPLGALSDNIGLGYGVAGAFLVPLDRAGILSLRLDLAAAEYGHETTRTAFSETVGSRVDVKVRTANTVAPGTLGIQLAAPAGLIRPYANAGAGAQVFYTDSRVEPIVGGYALASTVNQSDIAFAWGLGGGFYVPLATKSVNILLDVGAQYIHGGTTRYLGPGGITDLPGGGIAIAPMESRTNMVALRIGARIGR